MLNDLVYLCIMLQIKLPLSRPMHPFHQPVPGLQNDPGGPVSFDSGVNLPALPTMAAISLYGTSYVSDGALMQDVGSPPAGAPWSPPRTPEQSPAEALADPFHSSQPGSCASAATSPSSSQVSLPLKHNMAVVMQCRGHEVCLNTCRWAFH